MHVWSVIKLDNVINYLMPELLSLLISNTIFLYTMACDTVVQDFILPHKVSVSPSEICFGA